MSIRRVVPNVQSDRFDESREFYVDFLGFHEVMNLGSIVTFASPNNPTAQISLIRPDEASALHPHLTVEVGDVDDAHRKAGERGLRIVYPLTDEPWGVRRFFVADPNGLVLNVMSHRQDAAPSTGG